MCLYQTERLKLYRNEIKDYEDKPFILIPDIVVEIVSPTDRYEDVERKVELYLKDGVKIVWLVKPSSQTVAEYTQDKTDPVTKRKTDVLSGKNVAQGFELNVSEIFE